MTTLLYQTNSYLKEFSAKVIHVKAELHAILLDKTAFYPGGGGQMYDKGIIRFNGAEAVLKRAKNSPEGILHIFEEGESMPEVDFEVTGILDWDRRYKSMRTHTAMHILCGTIYRDYGALVTGGDMELLKGRMDFEFENLTKDLVSVIESAVNKEVAAAREVRVAIHSREEAFKIPDLIRTKINLLPPHIKEVRTVEIVGLDLQADGGTHVRNTSEVGTIHITNYKSKGRINKRLYIEIEP
ncbi:MAG: alanyl-tRNA editing protein [Anaerolineaceae bacterium]|nr:alanyl-tRNA editing protein [Anaerolineaceae bacterium]